MSEIEDIPAQGWIIRKRHLPVLVCMLAFAALCIGVTGIYAGSTLAESKWEAQKLNYEQRLGTQSAQYALDAKSFSDAVQQFAKALDKMDAKNDRRAAERERAQTAAIAAAQKAAAAAAATAQKTDQILVGQEATKQQATEAASAAKATEKKLDTATRATAAVPPQPWVGDRR